MHAGHQSEVVARLKPDISVEAATHEISAVQYRIHLAYATRPVAEDVWSRPMIDDLVKGVRTQLLVLLCAVGCMLLIACLNLSNLLVARAASRRKEIAIRGSLGGSRLALIREQMSGACASPAHEKRCRPPFPPPLQESIAATSAANSSQDQHVGPHLQPIELVKFSVTALHRNRCAAPTR
jgi:hypothetical protein